MLRRQSSQNLSYPDVLGMISAGARLNTEAVQAALGIYPLSVAAGQSLEALILLQNIYDQRVEGSVSVTLPKRDAAGHALLIFTAQETIPVTLGPGEVGLLHIPITPQIGTPPGDNYAVNITIDIRHGRGKIIRDPSGGRVPGNLPMSIMRLNILRSEVGFGANQRSANTRLLNTLSGSFGVVPGMITVKTANHTPRYETLWDAKTLEDDQKKYAHIEERTLHASTSLSRMTIYEPLINETERRFGMVNFPLLPGEAIFIAKVLTYALEDGFQMEPGFNLTESRWFQRLAAFIDDPETLETPSRLARALFMAAIHDSVRLSYHMITRAIADAYKVKNENVGSADEQRAQANRLVDSLEGRVPMTLSLLYTPLMLAGLMLHASVRVPEENLWLSLDMIRQAWQAHQTSGLAQPALIARWFDQFAASAEEIVVRSRIPCP